MRVVILKAVKCAGHLAQHARRERARNGSTETRFHDMFEAVLRSHAGFALATRCQTQRTGVVAVAPFFTSLRSLA
jgi:hypothetical protein